MISNSDYLGHKAKVTFSDGSVVMGKIDMVLEPYDDYTGYAFGMDPQSGYPLSFAFEEDETVSIQILD